MNVDEILDKFLEENKQKVVEYKDIKSSTWIDDYGDIPWDDKETNDDLFEYGDKQDKLILKTTFVFEENKSHKYKYDGYEFVGLPYLKPADYSKKDRRYISDECLKVLIYLNKTKHDMYIYRVFNKLVNSKFYEVYTKGQVLGKIRKIRKEDQKPHIKRKKIIINHDYHIKNDDKYRLLYQCQDWEGFIIYKKNLYMKYLSENNERIIQEAYQKLKDENKYRKWTAKDIQKKLKWRKFSTQTIRKYAEITSTKDLIKLCIDDGIEDLATVIGISVRTITRHRGGQKQTP